MESETFSTLTCQSEQCWIVDVSPQSLVHAHETSALISVVEGDGERERERERWVCERMERDRHDAERTKQNKNQTCLISEDSFNRSSVA